MDFLALMLLLTLAGVFIAAGFVFVAAMRHDWSTGGMLIGCGASGSAGIAMLVALMLFALALPGDGSALAPLIARSLRIAAIILFMMALAILAIVGVKGDDWMELDWRRRRAFLVVLVVTIIGGFVGLNILHKS